MSVEKYRELGREAYREWRADEIAKRRIGRKAEIVERVVHVDRWNDVPVLEIPQFLRPDPVAEFIESERQSDETIEAARGRLWLELEVLLNRAKNGPLPVMDEARKRDLTSGLKGVQ